VGEALRAKGAEFGATTGRPRRCGWLDLVALRYAVALNGVTEIALTKADVLAGQESIKVAHSYAVDGVETSVFPSGEELERATPNLRDLPGFDVDLSPIQSFDALPEAVQSYVGFIEQSLGVTISIVSTGPGRHQTIWR
jgi:adenylosuccinate synthase